MFCLLALLMFGGASTHAVSIDNLGIKADNVTRWYSYANEQAGFYFGEARGPNDAPYQGWTVYDNPVLKDYSLSVNGRPLSRSDAKTVIYPDRLVRTYRSGIVETFTFLDNLNAFVVQIHSRRESRFEFGLLLNSRTPSAFSVSTGRVTIIENKSLPEYNYGKWIAVAGKRMHVTPRGKTEGRYYSPASFQIKGRSAAFVVSCGIGRIQAEDAGVRALMTYTRLLQARKRRMQEVVDAARISTGNRELDRAIAWAKLSLNSLVTNQGMRGIWAGLPWFNNYWGRDSFISLPAATLWQGDFRTAKQILLAFAAQQDTDTTSVNYGRIPNLITPHEISYNTADGTPWFINSVYLYFAMTNDRRFLYDIFPVVRRAIDGVIRHHFGKDYFLYHGDQETWMDAVGPNGPYTPRGSRGVDLQSLWLRQILETRYLSQYAGDDQLYGATTELAKRLVSSFNGTFIDTTGARLYDRLTEDGTPDTTLRPNEIFALWMVGNRELKAAILKNAVEKLCYPWGVATLYQGDPNFHPYHHDEPYYVPDAAYHSGTVWPWLTGPLVTDLVSESEQDFAFRLTSYLTDEILRGKTAGTLPELFDAFPRKGKTRPDESGAFSQAWSLAEYLKSFYEDYLGVQVDLPEQSIILYPRLPEAMKNVSFRIVVGQDKRIDIAYRFDRNPREISIHPVDSLPGEVFKVFVMYNKTRQVRTAFYLQGKDKVDLSVTADTIVAVKNGKHFPVNVLTPDLPHDTILDHLEFQKPAEDTEWTFLKEAKFRILKRDEVKKWNRDAAVFAEADDSTGDDRGPEGRYVYPTDPSFKPGILDITHAGITYDAKNVYFDLKFRHLTDPMWHPEYGFQLTFAAIAIGDGSDGQRSVGRNSDFTLPEGRGFQKIVYVGGGIEVFDKSGSKIAAYIPSPGDTVDPLGDASTGEIRFSLPVSVIGEPKAGWKVTLLAGAQDDHGGGGIGDFRSVVGKATQWQGGGKTDPSLPNVYDELIVR